MNTDDERREALVEIMELPDPPEMAGRRTHVITVGRDERRTQGEINSYLALAYVGHRRHDLLLATDA